MYSSSYQAQLKALKQQAEQAKQEARQTATEASSKTTEAINKQQEASLAQTTEATRQAEMAQQQAKEAQSNAQEAQKEYQELKQKVNDMEQKNNESNQNNLEQKTNLEMAKEAAKKTGSELPEGRIQVSFHGTTEKNAQNMIQSQGESLRTTSGQKDFCMTTDYNTAYHFAERTANKEGGKASVVGIAISEADYEQVKREGRVMSGEPISDRQGMYQEKLSPAAVESLKNQETFFFKPNPETSDAPEKTAEPLSQTNTNSESNQG